MSKKQPYKAFRIPIYKRDVYIFPTLKAAVHYMPCLGETDAGAAFVQPVHLEEAGVDALVMVFTEDRYMCPSVIAHESTHLAIAVLDYAGIPISVENQETLAYLTGYCTEQVTKYLDKYKAKKNGKPTQKN